MHSKCKRSLLALLALLWFAAQSVRAAPVIDLSDFEAATLGKHIEYFQEQENNPLSLAQAITQFSSGNVLQGSGNSLSLGIGVRPVWIKVEFHSPPSNEDHYRIAVETPWLDYIDAWMVHGGTVQKHIVGGDAVPFAQRPMPYKVFAFETRFSPGTTSLYFRIESLGPMAIPLRMSTVEAAVGRDILAAYQYGFLYGVMLALALYNIVLFLITRQKIFGLYSLYLTGFVVNSLSYTGQLHTVITPDLGPYFQDWTDTFLMITYSIAGLLFARELLNTRAYAPKLDKLTLAVTTLIPLGIVIGALNNHLVFSLVLAFILNSSFVLLFIAIGVAALRVKADYARLFLFSSVQAALCIGISTMAVGGILPYNDITFKLIEVGMALEAVLLAVIVAQQFRMAQRDKVLAETYARTDILTGLLNRRGFQEMANKLWENLVRNGRNVAIVLLDIDHFKSINDTFGHLAGDEVLAALAKCIQASTRKGDVAARWGGEEFILLLPEADQQEALVQTERLRQAIEAIRVPYQGESLAITCSFGVASANLGGSSVRLAEQANHDQAFEQMVNEADQALYGAKSSGRNQVFVYSTETASPKLAMSGGLYNV